jgi:hypothetical protein
MLVLFLAYAVVADLNKQNPLQILYNTTDFDFFVSVPLPLFRTIQ